MLCRYRKRIVKTVLVWAVMALVCVGLHHAAVGIPAQDADTSAAVQYSVEYVKKPTPEDARAWAEVSAYGIIITIFWIAVGVWLVFSFLLFGLVIQYLRIIKWKLEKIESNSASKDDVLRIGEVCGHALDRSHDLAVTILDIKGFAPKEKNESRPET